MSDDAQIETVKEIAKYAGGGGGVLGLLGLRWLLVGGKKDGGGEGEQVARDAKIDGLVVAVASLTASVSTLTTKVDVLTALTEKGEADTNRRVEHLEADVNRRFAALETQLQALLARAP